MQSKYHLNLNINQWEEARPEVNSVVDTGNYEAIRAIDLNENILGNSSRR